MPADTTTFSSHLQHAAQLRREDRLLEAISATETALEWANNLGDDDLIAQANLELADLHRYVPNTMQAFRVVGLAIRHFKKTNAHALPRALVIQGMVLGDMGDHNRALDIYREALALLSKPEHHDLAQEAFCYGAIGVSCTQLADFEQAEDAYVHALSYYSETGNHNTECHLWNNLAIIRIRQLGIAQNKGGNTGFLAKQAHNFLLEAERLNLELNSTFVRAAVNNSRGDLLRVEGQLEPAVQAVEAALAAYTELNLPRGMVDALTNLGEIRLEQQHLPEALELLSQAAEIVSRFDLLDHERKLLELQARALEQHGDYQAALSAFKRYHQLVVDLQQLETQKKLQQLALRQEIEQVASENRDLHEQKAEMGRMAFEDALTRLGNRRAFDAWHKNNPDTPYALLVIDIDHFKKVNDTFSHATGDLVLQHVAALLRQATRQTDLVTRFGGEEFVIVLAQIQHLSNALENAERVRLEVQKHNWAEVHPDLHITISLGVVLSNPGASVATLLEVADQHLYTAKREGRNRVVG
jgi:two-component system, cell cycle response regulator